MLEWEVGRYGMYAEMMGMRRNVGGEGGVVRLGSVEGGQGKGGEGRGKEGETPPFELEVEKKSGRKGGKVGGREGENKRVFEYPRFVVNILFVFSLYFYLYCPLLLHLLSYICP